jgi:hypothetical protein
MVCIHCAGHRLTHSQATDGIAYFIKLMWNLCSITLQSSPRNPRSFWWATGENYRMA